MLLRRNLKSIPYWILQVWWYRLGKPANIVFPLFGKHVFHVTVQVTYFYCINSLSPDVEQGKVDKKAMLMYLSALYEVLRNLEPAVVETTTREVSEVPGEEGIVKTTTSFAVEV